MWNGDRCDDRELVKSCLSGSEAAWTEFHRQYHLLIEAVVKRHSRSSTDDGREDLIQEVYKSLVEALAEYDGHSSSLKTFVSVVAGRTCIDCWRGCSTMSRTGINAPVEHHDCTDPGHVALRCGDDPPDAQVAKAESRQLVKTALRALSSSCQELLKLRFFSDLTYEEIADNLGKKVNSVNVQVLRCITHLRAAYVQIEGGRERV
jgi:RNA polymerase sigma factor (sigma-70 family)